MDGQRYLSITEWNTLFGITESYNAPRVIMEILGDKERREELFRKALDAHIGEVTYDWFHKYFQDEHADRKNQKQDFTPNSVSTLLTKLVSGERKAGDTFYEPCAGTGGIIIKQWDLDRKSVPFFEYEPSMFLYQAEEMSERAIPFLLFNLMIRGMNASVVQCDVLSRKAKAAYFIQNEKNDHMTFSNLYAMPVNDSTADYFGVEWDDGVIYQEFDEVGEYPEHLGFLI